MNELKKCPFCGGEAKVSEGNLYFDVVQKVRCTRCFASSNYFFVNHPRMVWLDGKHVLDESTRYTAEQAIEKAIEAWNRRAYESGTP